MRKCEKGEYGLLPREDHGHPVFVKFDRGPKAEEAARVILITPPLDEAAAHGGYPSGSVTDPRGPSSGASRVLRGGSWVGGSLLGRAAYRFYFDPDARNLNLGFRVARPP